ncbi:MAG: hypothetical protein ACRD2D_03155 [Terriglobales bacterium]
MTKILLVDGTNAVQPFLGEMLQQSGKVTHFETAGKALHAVKRGLPLDVAVLHYRLSLTPLIQAIRHEQPQARIVCYGAPRPDTPLGVDQYLNQPLLSAELRTAVEKHRSRRREN